MTRSAIDHRVHAGIWQAVDHGTYRQAGTPASWHQRLMAACLVGPAVASHRAAAILWDAPRAFDELIEVTAWRHLRRHAGDVAWHESRYLDERDVTVVDAIPVTRPTRTLVDLGAVLELEPMLTVYDDFVRRGLATHTSVWREADRLGDRRIGVAAVQRMLDLRPPDQPVPQSVLESRFDEVARAAGLSSWVRQHNVFDRTGRLIGRLDFASLEEHVGIELDGKRHHDPDQDRVRDLEMNAVGWHTVRVSSRELVERPSLVVAAIQGALHHKRRI